MGNLKNLLILSIYIIKDDFIMLDKELGILL